MGFDMYHKARDTASYDEAMILVQLARDARDLHPRDSANFAEGQDRVREAVAAAEAQEDFYFRSNIWGIEPLVASMARLGMLDDSEGPTASDWHALGRHDSDSPEYDAALVKIIGGAPERPGGLCPWKFSSNDGWHITTAECVAALAAWEGSKIGLALVDPAWHSRWPNWIQFLRLAVERDGFEVF